ncbi:hypothetical protein [Polaromonas naphthalenivorans]|nr:hypothetical protein [Polaromonas naphthalenivorans]
MTIAKQHVNPLIGLRLKPEDHARVERIAELEQRPLGSLCRLFVLKCLAEYEQNANAAVTPPASAA